jgi:hypothetical protein
MRRGKLEGSRSGRRTPRPAETLPPNGLVLGLKPRTGRAGVVAIAGPVDAPRILLKTRIDIATTFEEGAVFHVVQALPLNEARTRVEAAERRFIERARVELARLQRQLGAPVVTVGIVAGKPKRLPPLEAILKAHPLVHAAEGALYRRVFTAACAALCATPPFFLPQEELIMGLAIALAVTPEVLQARLAAMGKASGRPWAEEQKQATLAAWTALTAVSG